MSRQFSSPIVSNTQSADTKGQWDQSGMCPNRKWSFGTRGPLFRGTTFGDKKPFVTLEWPARPIAKQRHRVSDLRTVNVSFKATFWVFNSNSPKSEVSILVDRDEGLDSVDPDVGQLTCHNPAWCCGGLFLKTCLWSLSRLSVSLYVFETNCYDMKASHHRTQSKHIKSCSFLSASIWLQHTNTVCLSCGFV